MRNVRFPSFSRSSHVTISHYFVYLDFWHCEPGHSTWTISVRFNRISFNYTSFDSSWPALSKVFWAKFDSIKSCAVNRPQSGWVCKFLRKVLVKLRPNASRNWTGAKRRVVGHLKSYSTTPNTWHFMPNCQSCVHLIVLIREKKWMKIHSSPCWMNQEENWRPQNKKMLGPVIMIVIVARWSSSSR